MKTQLCLYNGLHYSQPERLAKDTGLSLVKAERVFYGHEPELLPGAEAKNTVTYEGKEFSSVRQLAKHLKYTTNVVGKLVREKGTVEEGIAAYGEKKDSRSVVVFGQKFNTKVEAYRHFDVPKQSISYLMSRGGMTLEEAITEYKNKENEGIEYEGRKYATYSEFFAAHGLAIHVGRQRLYSGWSLHDIVTKPVQTKGVQGVKVTFRGVTYATKEELAAAHKLAVTQISNTARYNGVSWGAAFMAFVDLFENHIGYPEENLTRRPFAVYDDIWFSDATELSKHLNVDHLVYTKVRHLMLRNNQDKNVEEPVGVFDVYKRITELTSTRFLYEGELYTYMELDRVFPKTVVFAVSNGLAEKVEVREYPECTYDETKKHVEVRAVFDALIEKYRGQDLEEVESSETEQVV